MIKKTFQVIGLLVLMCVSFMYTNNAMVVVRTKDPIMIEIENNKEMYYNEPLDCTINGNDIIPGYDGMEVDVLKSYESMKKYGLYNEKMMEFKTVIPKKTITQIYDKYIINGNRIKNQISLIFKVENTNNIDKILEILNSNDTYASFFFDKDYIEQNSKQIKNISNIGHDISHISYNSDMAYINRLLNSLGGLNKYCYVEEYDNNVLNSCKSYNMHVIKPFLLDSSNMIINLKKNIDSNNLLAFKISDTLIQNLDYIIKYIKQKGYTITTISNHLNEKRLEK